MNSDKKNKPQFTKDELTEFLIIMFEGSIIVGDKIINHYYNKVKKAGYIKE